MSAAMLRQTRMTILLSLNAVAILIAGIVVAGAIGLNNKGFRVVNESSDIVSDDVMELSLIEPVTGVLEAITHTQGSTTPQSSGQKISYSATVMAAKSFDTGTVSGSELWNVDAVTIYQSADMDICVNDSLGDLGEMYWQTSNQAVIKGFYGEARSRLGYSTARCRYPAIVGTGTTTITAGTMDGTKRDTITVTVIAPPAEQWKHDVLTLVNQERAKYSLPALTWGDTCAQAAQVRAQESIIKYDHSRPDGSSWETVCRSQGGGIAGENLAAGNTAVSPETVVQTWMNSESHRENILSDKFTKMAVGFVFDNSSQYKTYWSQFFSTY